MFCSNCGKQIEEASPFCPNCGEKTGSVVQSPVQVQPAHEIPQTEYLVSINNQQSGPYSLGQLEAMIKNGQVTLSYWACVNNSGNWIRINDVPELKIIFDRLYKASVVQPTVPSQAASATQQPTHTEWPNRNIRLRHGFTSFWLWLNFLALVISGLIIVLAFMIIDDADFNYYYSIDKGSLIFLLPSLGTGLYGLWNIIKNWKQSGFMYYVISHILGLIWVFLSSRSSFVGMIITSIIGIGITYWTLKIRNSYNAKST
jgi:hypothetical protein